MPGSVNDVKSIFGKALEFASSTEREAYLAQACGHDPRLRAEVESLLQAGQGAGEFFADLRPSAGPTIDLPASEYPGDVVGSYKLLEQIGEGGFGVVFLAEQQQPVRRKVALKIIKPGMDTRQVIARFEAERQALAIMDHSNIAKVFDGGVTLSGRPYFVMELVKGVPITDYCDQNNLTPRQRLELFVPVCQAVQHAHQKGIIHRDLKPGNILVSRHDTLPVVKVIDFGVAKALGPALTDKTLFTSIAQMVGTPLYMSPEQAGMSDLDVDTRSDIYSLGVLLYELLTGTTPFTKERFQQAAHDEIRRIIREEEPPKPSTRLSESTKTLPSISAQRHTEPAKLTNLVRGELDWIVMKALEKDRTRRYETANGFAMDVQRYLADEPVQACPPSAWYRFRKFARRNRRTLVTAALLGAMLLVAAGSFGWMARDRAIQRGRNMEAIETLLDQCEEALRADRVDRGDITLEAAERRAADGGAETLAGRLTQYRTDLEMLRELDEVDKFRWTPAEGGPPSFAAQAARWRAALAAYGMMRENNAADAAARVNVSPIRDRLLGAFDAWLGREPSVWVRAVLRAADPDPYRDVLRDALAAGDRSRYAALLGRPDALAQPARFVAALPPADEVPLDRRVALLEGALRARPGNLALLMALGNNYSRTHPEHVAERVRWFQAAVAAHPGSAVAHNSLALALRDKGDRDGTIAEVREAVRLDPKYAAARVNLGLTLRKQDLDGAIAEIREAIRHDPKFAVAHDNLGLLLKAKGDVDGALAEFHEALRLDPNSAGAHNNLAWLLAVGPDGVRNGKLAVVHATRACELTGWKNPGFIDTLAAAYASTGDFDRAVEYEKRALSFPAFVEEDGKGGRDRLELYVQKKPYRETGPARREPAAPRSVKP